MRKFMVIVLLVVLLSLFGCAKVAVEDKSPVSAYKEPAAPVKEPAVQSKYAAPTTNTGAMQTVKLTTDDDINIVGSYYPGNEKAVILLHMLNRNRHDWDSLATDLNTRGYTVMTIDLRGHGDSDLNWMDFKDADFKKMTNDGKAAADYIYLKNSVPIERTYVVGASIGANLAVMYGVTDSKVKKVVMLSPGSVYHGLNPLEAVNDFDNPILFVYSQLDNYAATSSRTMEKMGKGDRTEIAYRDSKAHGDEMFNEHGDLESDILDFLKS